jgi:hypothetical protein
MTLIENIKIIGCLCATCGMIVMYFLFMAAYASNDKSTCININNYGEANFEVIMIHFQVILSILGAFCIILFRQRQKPRETKPRPHNLASV